VRSKQTYTEQQRRAQLVSAAVEVIAERGYVNASLSAIAQRAGTSKGVLLYHFAGKDDLVAAVVDHVFTTAREIVGPKVAAAEGPRARLRAYVTERIRFLATHATAMRALLDIAITGRTPAGDQEHAVGPEPAVRDLEALLAAGQAEGVFRAFELRPMALLVSQAVDGVLLQLAGRPDLDLELYAREIATSVDLATRRTP
jgi:TetR/AcrR family transcriptional regulator, fatty acid metabolism regulator protein